MVMEEVVRDVGEVVRDVGEVVRGDWRGSKR